MRKTGYWSTSRIALAGTVLGATLASANAQTQRANPGAPSQTPVPPPAQRGQGSSVVVTGTKGSLRSSQQIKQQSDSIVDAIVAEDIGKLPDNNASDALARVPGIQVERFNDEAGQILIRGLPDVTTTFNGREIFSAEGRGVALQDFSAGALAGLEVYKSGTSDLIEPGLAGLVNVRTRRPFDFDGFVVAGGIRGSYNDQSERADPIGNILISDRWNTGIGEIGALVNFAYTQAHYRNAVRYNERNIVNPDLNADDPEDDLIVTTPGVGRDFMFPDSVGNYFARGKRWRPSLNGSIQWRPSADLEVYLDGVWLGYRANQTNEWFNVNLARESRDGVRPIISNVVLSPDEPNKAISLSKTGGYPAEIFRSTNNERTNTYQGALGFIWKMDRARLTGDFAYTNSTFTLSENSMDAQFTSAPDVNVEFENNFSSSFDLGGYDALNPDNYAWRGLFDRRRRAQSEGVQWRADLEIDTDMGWLPMLQFGVRAVNRTARVQDGNRYANTSSLDIPLASIPSGALETVTDGFRRPEQRFRNWLMPSYNGIRDNFDALRALAEQSMERVVAANPDNVDFADQLRRWRSDIVPWDPVAGFSAQESSYTAYAQGKYKLEVGSVDIDGTFGVRIVNTDGTYRGASRLVNPDGSIGFTDEVNRQNYVDILPSATARIRFTPQLQMRLAYNHTRTRPTFGQLNPSFNITFNDQGTGASIYDAFGSGGNPDLKPLTSKNYDASLEYYFSSNGSVTLAAFYRDLDGFISSYQRDVQDPVYGLIQITRPENAGKGTLKGLEFAFQSALDFLPGLLSGLGVQANVTYLDAENALPSVLGEEAPMVRIPGVSKWTYNLTAYYEKGPLSTRISYNRRSDYINLYNRNPGEAQYAGEGTMPVTRLDYSLAYDITKSVTFTIDINNILAEPFRNYRNYNANQFFARDVREEGRYYGAGVRFRF